MGGPLIVTATILFFFILAQWLASLLLEDASILDRFWGGGFARMASWIEACGGTRVIRIILGDALVW